MMIIDRQEAVVKEAELAQEIESLQKKVRQLKALRDYGVRECNAKGCQIVAFDVPVSRGDAEYGELVRAGWYVFIVIDRDDCGMTSDHHCFCPYHHKEGKEREKKLDGRRIKTDGLWDIE